MARMNPTQANPRKGTPPVLVDVWSLKDDAEAAVERLLNMEHPPHIVFGTGLLENRTEEVALALAVAPHIDSDVAARLQERIARQHRTIGPRPILFACHFTSDNARGLLRLPVHDVCFVDRATARDVHQAILLTATWSLWNVVREIEARRDELPWEFLALVRNLVRDLEDPSVGLRSVAELSEQVGCSESHLARKCADAGIPPATLQRRLAFLAAHALRLRGHTWTEASLMVGYSSSSSFTRMIRGLTGRSPAGTETIPTPLWAQEFLSSYVAPMAGPFSTDPARIPLRRQARCLRTGSRCW